MTHLWLAIGLSIFVGFVIAAATAMYFWAAKMDGRKQRESVRGNDEGGIDL